MKTTAKRLLITVIILTAFFSVIKTGVFAETWVYDSFETGESLSCWTASEGGSVAICNERYKIDQNSLKWSYKKGGSLTLSDCTAFANIKSFRMGNGFKLWIYNTNKTDADMTIRIGNSARIESQPSYIINVNMNFEGWRCIWARVNEFARTGYSNDDADTLMLVLPEDMGEGVLYLDSFEVTGYVHYAACSDFQITNMPTTNTTYQYASYLKIPENIEETECTSEQTEAFKTIKKRFDDYIIDEDTDYASLDSTTPERIRYNQTLSKAQSYINTHNKQSIIRREDGSIDAAGLTSSQDSFGTKIASYEKTWVSLALDWKINKNEKSREKLLELFDYFYEQGWAEGSSMGAMRFDEIRTDGYAFAVYMMKDELKETGRWERELANLRWRSEFGMVFAYDDPELAALCSVDADKIRSVVLFQLMYILCMEDSPEKVAYMKAYTKYFNDIVMPRPGSDGGIKNDYTLWHHTSPYMSAYGSEAISIFAQIKYLLSDTCFDASEEATNVIKKSLDVYRVSADKYDIPIRGRGRFPESDNTMVNVMASYAFLAASGDKKSAEIFLDLWEEMEKDVKAAFSANPMPSLTYLTTIGQYTFYKQVKEKALAQGYKAAQAPEGVHVFPYGGYAVSRIGDTMAAVSGWSKYIWDYEGSTTENFYGRYTNYGSLTVTGKDGFYGGGIITKKGWDWARWPGTTAKHLSNAELEVKGNARNLSDETFLGGVAKGNSGVYAMKLHDIAYDNSFYANKSYFMFNDSVICLGSDINNSDTEHNTETTLFQNVMPDSSAGMNVDGTMVDGLDYKNNQWQNKSAYLTDTVGNAYVIPDSTGLTVERRKNTSLTFKGVESSGELAMAYIDHGTAPAMAGYEYVVLPGGDEKKAAEAFYNPGYEVVRKDSLAHIVKNTKTSETGYAIFESTDNLSAGVLKSVSAPCIIMEKADSDGVSLSFCDPDLRIKTSGTIGQMLTESEEKATRVVLFGQWYIARGNEKVRIVENGDNTTLEFLASNGAQYDVEMKKAYYPDGSIELCNSDEIYINETFSASALPLNDEKGTWKYRVTGTQTGTYGLDNGTMKLTGYGYSQYLFNNRTITYNAQENSENKYLLEFDFVRNSNTSGVLYPYRMIYAADDGMHKDLASITQTDAKGNITYTIEASKAVPSGQNKRFASGIKIGDWVHIEILYTFGSEKITADITVYDMDGNIIGAVTDYALDPDKNDSRVGIKGFGLCSDGNSHDVQFDNVRLYKYKNADDITVSDILFTDASGNNTNLDAIKKGDEVSLNAKINVRGNIKGTVFFAVYDSENRLVSVVSEEALKDGEINVSQKLFTAKEDGKYIVRVFVWEDTENIVPVKNAIEVIC